VIHLRPLQCLAGVAHWLSTGLSGDGSIPSAGTNFD
jgi:hypothetical protein